MPDHCVVDSPIGCLRLFGSEGYLIRIEFINEKERVVAPTTSLLKESVSQLGAYFDGKLKQFDIPLKPAGSDFQLTVWQSLGEIPFGRSWSYAQQARFLNNPKGIRAVAAANGRNPLPIVVPCHRVIGADNSLVGYGGELWRKEWLLRHEGHPVFAYKQGELLF